MRKRRKMITRGRLFGISEVRYVADEFKYGIGDGKIFLEWSKF